MFRPVRTTAPTPMRKGAKATARTTPSWCHGLRAVPIREQLFNQLPPHADERNLLELRRVALQGTLRNRDTEAIASGSLDLDSPSDVIPAHTQRPLHDLSLELLLGRAEVPRILQQL